MVREQRVPPLAPTRSTAGTKGNPLGTDPRNGGHRPKHRRAPTPGLVGANLRSGRYYFLSRSGSSICPRCLRVTCPRSLSQWFGTWWDVSYLSLWYWELPLVLCFLALSSARSAMHHSPVSGGLVWFAAPLFRIAFVLQRQVPTVSKGIGDSGIPQQSSLFTSEASFQFSFVREAYLGGSMLQDHRSRVPVCSYSGRGPIFGNDAFCERFSLDHLAQQVQKCFWRRRTFSTQLLARSSVAYSGTR